IGVGLTCYKVWEHIFFSKSIGLDQNKDTSSLFRRRGFPFPNKNNFKGFGEETAPGFTFRFAVPSAFTASSLSTGRVQASGYLIRAFSRCLYILTAALGSYRNTIMRARRGDFMFCNLCGTMMALSSGDHVECPLCKSSKRGKAGAQSSSIYVVMVQEIRRDLGISDFEGNLEVKDMEINKQCEKCSNTKLKFSTRQMRSADEGQTTFYHCAVCSHTFTEN
ncbi:DNA-directed RNA polymerase I subunit RPA12, partial [Linum perenne]